MKLDFHSATTTGLEIKFFSREPNCIFKSYLKVLCTEISTSLGSLQKFEGAPGEFKGALGSRHPLISSPVLSCPGLVVDTKPGCESCDLVRLGLGIIRARR